MVAQTTWAKRKRWAKSRVSWTLAAEGTAASGRPSVATTTWYLVPALPRSVGLGPVSSPPRLARTEQLSTTTSQEVTSGPARTIRTRTTWTWRSTAVALQASRRRRNVEPHARPTAARSSRHWTPSRTKYRSVSTTLMVGTGGRPVLSGRFSTRSMIPATNAAALGPMLASPGQRHGKQTAGPPDAERLMIVPAFWKPLLIRASRAVLGGRRPRGARGPPPVFRPAARPVGPLGNALTEG